MVYIVISLLSFSLFLSRFTHPLVKGRCKGQVVLVEDRIPLQDPELLKRPHGSWQSRKEGRMWAQGIFWWGHGQKEKCYPKAGA